MAQDYVRERTDSGEDKDDMLGSFLRQGMTPLQAEAEILTQLSAGTDSNSVALRAIFLHVFTSPQAYNKLQAEIDNAAASGLISNPITNTESLKLPYLDACIREGMRIWPPFTGLTTKKINQGGEVIKGTFIPGGTSIATSFWGFQRNPVFGKDVEAFRPERWIEAGPEKRKEMERVNDLVFGSGRWSCLGKTMVLMEMRQVIVELMRNFDFTITQPTKPWVSKSYVFMLIEQMPVRISKRVDKSS
ncbi:Cytochrome P450 monooxygenase [Lachnellula suecica]|uniref:Cytochrome P450 monooxygenase n=1 Tax=Lachnellula suecica TaxID=602035 RepID=A0A8T9CIR3_9HELO|nr:Cytochrome P450 monooxygenase [Lachnellula suecica]